jgi:transposase
MSYLFFFIITKSRIMEVLNRPLYVGIDVSKAELVISYLDASKPNQWKKAKLANTVAAIDSWLVSFGTVTKHFVLEFTGVYSDRLIYCLNQHAALFSVVNPLQSRAMSKLLAKTHKNDLADAKTLSVLGEKMALKAYRMPNNVEKERKEAFSALTSLQKQEQQLVNQLHAFEFRVNPNPVAVNALKEVLKTVQQAIEQLQNDLKPKNEATEADQSAHVVDLISSIVGVGERTAELCVALFGDFKHFDSAKAFVKFVGLCPSEFTSGETVRGKNSITKQGNTKIRSQLFNCARCAIQHNQKCKAFYQQLVKNGKNGKVALTAVMQKLARLIYGVVASNKRYDYEFKRNKQICP